MSPDGTFPETETFLLGVTGSSLTIVMLADFTPRLEGLNLIVTMVEPPGLTINGNVTPGAINSPVEEVMLLTERLHPPVLLIVSGRSLKVPMHTSPKLPVLAIAVTIFALGTLPETATVVEMKEHYWL